MPAVVVEGLLAAVGAALFGRRLRPLQKDVTLLASPGQLTATRQSYAAIFLVSLVTLMFEILLTRVFSVVMWYHFAFMVISVAMFGVTAGPVLVYVLPNVFKPERTPQLLWLSCFSFSVLIPASAVVFAVLARHFAAEMNGLLLAYLTFMLPFVASGICVCLFLTRFAAQVGQLYAFDLFGAAFGCLAIVGLLWWLGPAGSIFALSGLAGLAAFCLSFAGAEGKTGKASIIWLAFLAVAAIWQCLGANFGLPVLNFNVWKNTVKEKVLFEKWNHFSCIRVLEHDNSPFAWGMSNAMLPVPGVEQMWLVIDILAATPVTRFAGNLDSVAYLKGDVTNFVHYLRPHADVAAIGVGGGRDILSALVFKQKSVTGIELNDITLDLLKNRYADFTGHLDRYPNVTLVLDEGRSYINRSGRKFDIIEASLIDTWAATAAGAFILSENSLYTTDGWQIFWKHLSDRGVISFSRWYGRRQRPDEFYRLLALAVETLTRAGVSQPQTHIIALASKPRAGAGDEFGIATLLVCKQQFSPADVELARQTARRLDFEILIAPDLVPGDQALAQLVNPATNQQFMANHPANIAPPTDDSPFFFNFSRFDRNWLQQSQIWGPLPSAVRVFGSLLTLVTALTVCVICLPLAWSEHKGKVSAPTTLVGYFTCLGLGFMFLEIAMIERLTLYLGHPIFGLTVVLFSFLVGAGAGSYLSSRSIMPKFDHALVLFAVLGLGYAALFSGFAYLDWLPLAARLALSLAVLLPIGIVLGMLLPLGLRMADANRCQEAKPWLWAVNGAASIWSSVAAMALAMALGIRSCYIAGIVCYVLAMSCVFQLKKKQFGSKGSAVAAVRMLEDATGEAR